MLWNARTWKWMFLCVFASMPALMGAQCGELLNKVEIKVTIDRDFDFEEVDISKYTSAQNLKIDAEGKLPAGSPTAKVPVDIAQPIDFSDHPDVQKYGKKLAHALINVVEVQVLSNSVNIDLPRINVLMSQKDAKNFQLIGFLSGIPAGQMLKENLIKDSSATTYIESLLLQFKFDAQAKTELEVKAGTPVPKGKLKLRIHLNVTLGVAPFR